MQSTTEMPRRIGMVALGFRFSVADASKDLGYYHAMTDELGVARGVAEAVHAGGGALIMIVGSGASLVLYLGDGVSLPAPNQLAIVGGCLVLVTLVVKGFYERRLELRRAAREGGVNALETN